jgi:hypothetical protein
MKVCGFSRGRQACHGGAWVRPFAVQTTLFVVGWIVRSGPTGGSGSGRRARAPDPSSCLPLRDLPFRNPRTAMEATADRAP